MEDNQGLKKQDKNNALDKFMNSAREYQFRAKMIELQCSIMKKFDKHLVLNG